MSNWSIDFAPFLPGTFFIVAIIFALALVALLLWRRSRGAFLRTFSRACSATKARRRGCWSTRCRWPGRCAGAPAATITRAAFSITRGGTAVEFLEGGTFPGIGYGLGVAVLQADAANHPAGLCRGLLGHLRCLVATDTDRAFRPAFLDLALEYCQQFWRDAGCNAAGFFEQGGFVGERQRAHGGEEGAGEEGKGRLFHGFSSRTVY